MAAFSYAALDDKGRQQKGILEADSARQVRQLLRDKGLAPLTVEPTMRKQGASVAARWVSPSLRTADLALITRQLATLVQSGIPVEEALNAVAQQTENNKVRGLVLAVRARVLEGHTLANSLAEFPNAFPELYRATVAAGEHAGHLDGVLNRLADYTEAAQAARQKVQLALLYPIILFVMAIAIVAGLMTFVVPDVVAVFVDQGQALPGLTVALIATSDFIVNYGWLLLIAVGLLIVAARYALQQPAIRLAYHRRLLHMPLIARFSRGANTSRFASTLAILSTSGVPLVDALKIAGEVLSNQWLREKVRDATQQVREGSSLKKALERSGYFPPMMLHMIASGEQSGELDNMLERVATAQQRDLESLIATMLGIFEPLMLLFMGFCVLIIVIAILQPIFNLNQLV